LSILRVAGLFKANVRSNRRARVPRKGLAGMFGLAAGVLVVLAASAPPCLADRFFSVDLGYYSTTSNAYQDGFIYGVGMTEGEGKVALWISALRFGNTFRGESMTSVEGKVYSTPFEEEVNDFVLTLGGVFRLNGPRDKNRLMVGAGPQVHFVNSKRDYPGISYSGRDFRLGAAAFARYRRRLDMFGQVGIVLTASYAHMQSVARRTDQYEPPTQSMNITSVTAGIAFPF
jgi:hypothetical protein